MSNHLIQILQRTVSQNPQDQKQALDFLQSAAEQNFPDFVKELSIVLQLTNVDQFVRQAAGLQLKNVLVSKEDSIRDQYLKRWLQLPAEHRDTVKKNSVLTLGTERSRPSIAAQCVAAIACAELPVGMWNDVIQFLMQAVTDANSSEEKKEACLEALGYICHDINPQVLESQSNEILTAIVAGMHSSQKNNHVKLAATNALLNSLEFTRRNFENQNECNQIMQVVCETTQSVDDQVKVAALQCLVRIMSLYYQRMEAYMKDALFPITVDAMRNAKPEVALQGVEFWSSVCEEEIALQVEAEEAAENNQVPQQISRHYAKGACKHLSPILLEKLAQQNEDDDEDEWTPSKAAGVCVMLLAQCVGDTIIECVLPFLQHFGNSNWKYKEAAIMAFGSILDGPDPAKLNELVSQAISPLIGTLSDQNVKVRDTAAWTIGRVCEMSGEVVTRPDVLQALLPVMYNALSQEPRVAANICWALVALTKSAYEDASLKHGTGSGQPDTYMLSGCFQEMVNALIRTSERPDSNQSNLRLAAYETLMELIKNSPVDCYQIVQQTTVILLQKLEQLLTMEQQATDQNQRAQVIDLQALLCATLQSVLRKMRPEDSSRLSEPILRGLMQIMERSHGRAGNVMEEALMALGTLIESLGPQFVQYLQPVKPYILQGLGHFEDSAVCASAVGVVTDLCRSLEGQVLPILDEVMEILVSCIRDTRPSREVKVAVLSVFGDVALAIGLAFHRYIGPVMDLLHQACASAVINNAEDIDQVDYVHSLRENCILAYAGILQAVKSAEDGTNPAEVESTKVFVMQHLHYMANLVHLSAENQPVQSPDSVIAAAAGLVGDMASLYGATVAQVLDINKVNTLLSRGRRSRAAKTKTVSNWAAKELRKCNVVAA